MKLLILITVSILFAGCNTVKRFEKKQQQYQTLIDNYVESHPARIDTVTRITPGDTTVYEHIVYDTTTNNATDTLLIPGQTITKTIFRDRIIRDAIIRVVENKSGLELCNRMLNECKTRGEEKDKQLKGKNIWIYIAIGAIVLAALLTAVIVKGLFNKVKL